MLVQKRDSSDSSEHEPCCSCGDKEVQIDELKEALDTLVLLVSDMKAGGASDFKEILEQALSAIKAACDATEKHDVGASKARKTLASIKNTMSDCHIIEKIFNDLLDTYRADILPDVIEGWHELSPTERASVSKILWSSLFCRFS